MNISVSNGVILLSLSHFRHISTQMTFDLDLRSRSYILMKDAIPGCLYFKFCKFISYQAEFIKFRNFGVKTLFLKYGGYNKLFDTF